MSITRDALDSFIDLVERMRQAQREYFETKSVKAYREAINFETMVDAWIVARRIDEKKLANWTGQKGN